MAIDPHDKPLSLRARSLRPRLGQDEPLRDTASLDLELHCGETAILVGGSEPERMRLLLTLAGLRRPESGHLHFAGDKGMASMDDSQPHIGFISAHEPLLSTFSVRANIMLPRLYHFHDTPAEARAIADRLLDDAKYTGDRDVLPEHLSRLEHQQVMLARALVLDPALLFLHEPFELQTAGDWPRIGQRLRALTADGHRTLVVSTQNLAFAADNAAHIVFLHDNDLDVHPGWQAFAASRAGRTFIETMPFKLEQRAA